MKRQQHQWISRWHDAAWANAQYHIERMVDPEIPRSASERTIEGTQAIRALHDVIDMAANLVFQIAGGLPMLTAEIDLPDIVEPHDSGVNGPACGTCGKTDLPTNSASGLCVRCAIDLENAHDRPTGTTDNEDTRAARDGAELHFANGTSIVFSSATDDDPFRGTTQLV